uniref:Leucine-rich repeat receptor-like protein kinase n=1 Tax=Pohlia nutans TaxID=140635 RepID=A0A1P8DYV3_9BRYO|nr:leucine-rich repeat receptor-like protein kinase [Pohlia nutans]
MAWNLRIGRIARFIVAVAVLSGFFLCCAVADNSPWYVDVGLRRDADALLAFKEGVEDPSGVLGAWNYLQSPCAWPGVECSSSARVVGVSLQSAMLKGAISFKLGDLSELEILNLSDNELSDTIPEQLCNCRRLVSLDLRRNSLVGPIPPGILSLLPNLVEFLASENKLSGSLDRLIEQRLAPENAPCASLKLLEFSSNLLTGALPGSLSSCSELVELHLASNYLVGGVPTEYGELENLQTLQVESNILDQPLPESLKGCVKLRTLKVADNFVPGEIPSEYAQLRELRDFDVARNRLVGRIPQKGRWVRRASSFRGNDGLCGSPLPPCKDEPRQGLAVTLGAWFWDPSSSQQTPSLRRSLITRSSSRRRSADARWGLGIAAGVVTGAVAATLLALLTRVALGLYSPRGDLTKPIIFNKKITPQMLAFLEKDDALAGCRLLGQGGNGKVYQVQLEDDLAVAIKCVSNATHDPESGETFDAKQIRAELETLGFIRHRNLVQLLAYIFKSDSHLLVYEFMPGGSLQDALEQMAAGNLTLSWPERHRILCGVAQGLAYLHNESLGSSIVHRDLKPANILLDENYEAKLGDFGLAAIVPLKATHATTNVLAGTIGFIAPEYHQTMRYSQKSDVFSYGVVMAQLVTARNPTDNFVVENGGSIGLWLSKALQENNGVDAIDPALQGSGYESEILLAMKIAVFCTNLDPQQRPKSTEVLKMLLQIRNPEPVFDAHNLSVDSADSDTPIMSVSSGPLRFAGSESTTMTSSY